MPCRRQVEPRSAERDPRCLLRWCFLLVVGSIVLVGCERAGPIVSPTYKPFEVVLPDTSFHLSAEVRASVREGFDVDALERLLSMMPPEARPSTLAAFQRPTPGSDRVRMLVHLGHPKLQAVLEEVWAPMWEGLTDEELQRLDRQFPGREAARARRLRSQLAQE